MKSLQHPTGPPPDIPPDCRGEEASFGSRKRAGTGYLARSQRSGPGVIVLHDWFGLRAAPRAFCDALCAEGFTALAPDMYDGRVAGSVAEAEALMQSVPRETLTPRLESAAEFLQANWHPRLGVVGFSLGAAFALELAPRVGAEAAVIYYGLGEVDLSSWDTPLLGHFARVDEWEPLGEVEALFARFKEAGHDPELVVHEDAGHWFANTDVPEAADPVAAGRAWGATVEFLRYHLA